MKYKLYFNQNAGAGSDSDPPPNNNSNQRNSKGELPRHFDDLNDSGFNNSTDSGSFGTSEDSLPNDPRNSRYIDPDASKPSGRKIKTGNDENNANKKISSKLEKTV